MEFPTQGLVESAALVISHDGQWGAPSEVGREEAYAEVAGQTRPAWDYGQAVFEGMRARHPAVVGSVGATFRMERHFQRLLRSAALLGLAAPPRQVFDEAVSMFVKNAWSDVNSDGPDMSCEFLYVRVWLGGVGTNMGLPDSADSAMLVTGGMTAFAFGDPVASIVASVPSDRYRAWPGGFGAAKCVGNYGPCFGVLGDANADVKTSLWRSPVLESAVDEFTSMNVFVCANDRVFTPAVDDRVLDGISRRVVVEGLTEDGIEVSERPMEFLNLPNKAERFEVFGTGTAAGVVHIASLVIDGRTEPLMDAHYSLHAWEVLRKAYAGRVEGRS